MLIIIFSNLFIFIKIIYLYNYLFIILEKKKNYWFSLTYLNIILKIQKFQFYF